jgi:hypothetical protein
MLYVREQQLNETDCSSNKITLLLRFVSLHEELRTVKSSFMDMKFCHNLLLTMMYSTEISDVSLNED